MPQGKSETREEVQQFYANRAEESSDCGCDCSSERFYSTQLIADLPESVANFSLGCGNPISLANLQPGEVVLDLGSGGGLDCFLAAREVGEIGLVIGIDMTPEMLERAEAARLEMGLAQVEFRKGYLEDMPVDSNSVDVIISNCVINLSPDKPRVFAEMARVLKPGGRIAISDIVTQNGVSAEILAMQDSWNACAAGAIQVSDWEKDLEKMGFVDISITAKDASGELMPAFPETDLFSSLISATKRIL